MSQDHFIQKQKEMFKRIYSPYFKTEGFWTSWDCRVDGPTILEQMKLCDRFAQRIDDFYGLRILDCRKFVYGYLHRQTHLYFIFVIQHKEIIHITWVKKRNQISQAINRFSGYKIIVWYPQTGKVRMYLSQISYTPSYIFTGHERVGYHEFSDSFKKGKQSN